MNNNINLIHLLGNIYVLAYVPRLDKKELVRDGRLVTNLENNQYIRSKRSAKRLNGKFY